MIRRDDVTAIIPTRGDVDLSRILASIPFKRVIVWDNSRKPYDYKTLGRHFAAMTAATDVVYHQDDDIVFRNFDALLDAWEPGRVVANMPSPWWERTGYDLSGQVMFGAGSLVEHRLTSAAIGAYLAVYPWDDDFLTLCDCVLGYTVPSKRVDLGYEVLEWASAENRICTQPDAAVRRERMDARGRELRDAAR